MKQRKEQRGKQTIKKFEYLAERSTKTEEVNLKLIGEQGWELISVVPIQDGVWQCYRLFFKRELK